MKANIKLLILFSTVMFLTQSCCNQAGRNYVYEVLVKSSTGNTLDIDYTVDFGETQTKTVSVFPYYEEFGYNVKCKDVIPKIVIRNKGNSRIRGIITNGNVSLNNVDYYTLGSIIAIEKAGNIPPISSDSILNFYKNSNNPNYIELSATETTKTLTLNE
jgi:hypothetical protein